MKQSLKHLDRMAANKNLDPKVQELFRLEAWRVREALRRAAKETK